MQKPTAEQLADQVFQAARSYISAVVARSERRMREEMRQAVAELERKNRDLQVEVDRLNRKRGEALRVAYP
jgi:hypothetical protein